MAASGRARGRRTRPPPDPGAGAAGRVFAFRADEELVSILSAMPNASAFIRRAIARSLEEPCPVCQGRGVVAPGFRAELERLGGHLLLRRCDCCGAEYPAPCRATGAFEEGRHRLRAELLASRGEHLCGPCFESAPPCAICGMPFPAHGTAEFVRHWAPRPCGRALLTGRAR